MISGEKAARGPDDWVRGLHTDAVSPFLVPEHPDVGSVLVARVRVPAGAPIESVYLRSYVNGIDLHVPAVREDGGAGVQTVFQWFRAELILEQPSLRYYFLIRTTDGRTVYFDRRGPTWVYPQDDYSFTVDSAHRPPDWVRESVFYQIFPDRFHRGDPSLDVEPGEIRRPGAESRALPWTELPLPHELGGGLDFFNGDLPGVLEKLPYLANLGVNALYLNPIFSAKTNHRYDCMNYFAVDDHLGGDSALVDLLDEAHMRGMRVVLDVSINHIAAEHPWVEGLELKNGHTVNVVARDENGEPIHWAGVPELVKLDYSVSELRDVVYRSRDSVVQRYLRPPFSIDGWRFDVAAEVGRNGRVQDGHAIWREIRDTCKSINPEAYVIGEHWHDARRYLAGDQWDSAMNYFASSRPLRMWASEQDRFATVPVEEGAPGDPLSGISLAELLQRHFDTIPSAFEHAQFNLLDSHDTTRLHNNRTVFDRQIYEGVIMLLFLLPGTASIYYGDEVGIGGSLDGDHGKRHPMPWDESVWDAGFVELYRKMAHLKRESAALHSGSAAVLDAATDHLVYARFTDSEAIVLLLYRGSSEKTLSVDLARLGASSCREVFGSKHYPIRSGSVQVTVPPRSSALLRATIPTPFTPQAKTRTR